MTDAKSANWYSNGANEARRTEDLLPVYVSPDTAGDAAEEILEAGGGREDFLAIWFDFVLFLGVLFFFFFFDSVVFGCDIQ